MTVSICQNKEAGNSDCQHSQIEGKGYGDQVANGQAYIASNPEENSNELKNHPAQIFIKVLLGKSLALEVDDEETVEQLKERIQDS